MNLPQNLGPIIVAAIVVLVLLSIGSRSEQVAHNFKRLVLGCLLGGGAYLIAMSQHVQQAGAVVVGVIVALVVLSTGKRGRYINATEKRKAIAHYELNGKKYNRRKHEFDHVVPYSKGGNNSADNLRVVDRAVNRRKGASPPWWDVLGR